MNDPLIKICILTSVHPVFDTRIFHKEAKSLVKAGYDVTIIAQHESSQIIDNIKIVNLRKPRNRIERMTKTLWSSFRKALAVNAIIYHFHDPELIFVGLLLKCFGKKVIYDVHEDVPKQNLSRHYLPLIVRKPLALIISAIELVGAKFFDAIIPATPKIAKRFPPKKTIIVQNFPIITEFLINSPIPYTERPKSFIYVGLIDKDRGAIEMIRAFEYLNEVSRVKLEMAGEFCLSNIENTLRSLPYWFLVNYHGQVSRERLSLIFDQVRAGFVLFHPLPNHLDAQPNKLFEYMSAGLPVIASDFPLWRQIIDKVRAGILVDPLNPEEIANAMQWILDHPIEAKKMGERGRQAVESLYNWESEVIKLLTLYKELLQ